MLKRTLALLMSALVFTSMVPVSAIGAFAEECDHNYTASVTPPSCTKQGYTTYPAMCAEIVIRITMCPQRVTAIILL